MSQAEVQTSSREHHLDAITLQKWVNIPKCIIEAFQKLIDEAKKLEVNITNNRELQVAETQQFEAELKHLRKHMDTTFKDFLEQFRDLKETLNRTLKNMSVEISLGNNIGMDNTQKIKDQDQRMLRIEYENRDIIEKLGQYEDKSAFQKQLKTLDDEIKKKLDAKELQIKDNFNVRITEMLDIPGLVGSGRRFSNVKSLLQHLHDNFDKRLGTLKEIVDNKETFFRNGIAEMDLVNKIKAQSQMEIKQNVMKELETKFEAFVKENKAETEALIKKQIKEQPVAKPENSPKSSANGDVIGELFTTIKDLQMRIYYLEHPDQRTPSVDYLDHLMSSSGDINSSQPRLNVDSVIQQPMMVNRDIPNLLLDNGRPRSKSESKKKITEETKGSDSASKRLNRDFTKDMDRVENSILEEDEENSPRAKLPSIKQNPGVTSHKTSDADSTGGNNKAKSGKESSGVSYRKMTSKNAASATSNHSSFSRDSNGISPQQFGEKLSGKLQKTIAATIAVGRLKRAITTAGHNSKNKLNHSSSRDAEDLHNKSDHFGANTSVIHQRKQTEPDDRSFTVGDRQSTVGGNSPRDVYVPERTIKTEMFELNKFDLKNMEPHTVQFLNILEGEFESLRKALREIQGKPAEVKPNNNAAATKIPEITTRPRQSSFTGTTVGARINIGDKEAQAHMMMNTSTNMTQQQKKTSAYQMLKTVEKLKEEEERAWANAHPQPQQSGPQKYPLTQIRANGQNGGLKISEISGANSGGAAGQNQQANGQLARMPTIPIEAQNKLNSIPLTNTDRKEYTSAEVFKETMPTTKDSVIDSVMNQKVVLKHDVKSPEQGERPHQPQLKGPVGGSKSPEKRRRAATNYGGGPH